LPLQQVFFEINIISDLLYCLFVIVGHIDEGTCNYMSCNCILARFVLFAFQKYWLNIISLKMNAQYTSMVPFANYNIHVLYLNLLTRLIDRLCITLSKAFSRAYYFSNWIKTWSYKKRRCILMINGKKTFITKFANDVYH